MLRMAFHFGLRCTELLRFNPHRQDMGTYIEVPTGPAKAGQHRIIEIKNEADRAALDLVKSQIGEGEKLGWPFQGNGKIASLHQNAKRYGHLVRSIGLTKKALGVTGHGLRAQFAENRIFMAGILPDIPVGGKSGLDPCETDMELTRIAAELGLSLKRNMPYCIVSRSARAREDMTARAKARIQEAVASMGNDLPTVSEDRLETCSKLQISLVEDGVYLRLPQVHALWASWCRRCGTEWDNNPGGHVLFQMASYAV